MKESKTKAITIRGLQPYVMELLKKQSKNSGKSINQFVLDMIHQQIGLKKQKKYSVEYHDLDDLFGKWSEKEFDTIQRKIDSERAIDEEIWK